MSRKAGRTRAVDEEKATWLGVTVGWAADTQGRPRHSFVSALDANATNAIGPCITFAAIAFANAVGTLRRNGEDGAGLATSTAGRSNCCRECVLLAQGADVRAIHRLELPRWTRGASSTIRARVAPVADAVGHSPAASARIGVAWAGKARVWRGLALEFRVLAGGAQATRCRALPSLVCSRGTEERAIGA